MNVQRIMTYLRAPFFALLTAPLACVNEPNVTGPRMEIGIAPLTLPGVGKVCYDVRVSDGPTKTDPTVWAEGTPGLNGGTPDTGAICSSNFGNGTGGDITFVGTCVASPVDAGQDYRTNSVTVWLDGLYDTGGAYINPTGPDGWQNPCPDGCTLTAPCRENADTAVTFNLTILRQANQGFFDIGVNFSDVFCSAKVDCQNSAGEPLDLLFRPDTSTRDTTIVAAFACTAGPGATNETMLYRDPLSVTCGASPAVELDPGLTEGNAWSTDPSPADAVFQYAIFAGNETISCGGSPCNKRYWNVAIGLNDTTPNCTLETAMSASAGPLESFTTPAATTYPVIKVDLPLTDADGLACTQHPLDGAAPNHGVSTSYTPITTPETFSTSFDGASFTTHQQTFASCLAIKTAQPLATDGTYTIDPDGAGAIAPFSAYCDMTTDGGGWTLVANQAPTSLFSTLTQSDINPQNDGSLTSTFRLGNTRLAAFSKTTGWRVTSTSTVGAIVDRVFFKPACVVDWIKVVGPHSADCAVNAQMTTTSVLDTNCGIAYASTAFNTTISGHTTANCALGIGQNNSGAYCSLRMGNAGTTPLGAAGPCNYGNRTSVFMRLWVR